MIGSIQASKQADSLKNAPPLVRPKRDQAFHAGVVLEARDWEGLAGEGFPARTLDLAAVACPVARADMPVVVGAASGPQADRTLALGSVLWGMARIATVQESS